MPNRIYSVGKEGVLLPMDTSAYKKEKELQKLLLDHPELLAGEQVDPDCHRRWLPICREMEIPTDVKSGTKWKLDHLFLDQDAIPTLIEVKLSTNRESRRAIVGQMLDYAANGIEYWPAGTIQSAFELRCNNEGKDADECLAEFVGDKGDEDFNSENFWKQAEANLSAGRVRMVFVADTIPRELERIVEFLGQQLSTAEVFAIGLQRFQGGDNTTIVPLVIGAKQKASPVGPIATVWDETSFFKQLLDRRGPKVESAFRDLYNWWTGNGFGIEWWDKKGVGRYFPTITYAGGYSKPFALRTNGKINVRFKDLAEQSAFGEEQKREELLNKLNGIEGVSLSKSRLSAGDLFDGSLLTDKQRFDAFTACAKWVSDEIRRA